MWRSEMAGKVVLDVGGGTGILSMFAAKEMGAARGTLPFRRPVGHVRLPGTDPRQSVPPPRQSTASKPASSPTSRARQLPPTGSPTLSRSCTAAWKTSSFPSRSAPVHWALGLNPALTPARTARLRNPMQVDLIVSEWMGYCLLYGSALPHPRPPTPTTASAADPVLTSCARSQRACSSRCCTRATAGSSRYAAPVSRCFSCRASNRR